MVLEIIAQHFENYFAKREEILVTLEVFVSVCKPIVQDLDIDTPDDVIEKIGYTCHYVFQNAYNLHI